MENFKQHPYQFAISLACVFFGIYMLVQSSEVLLRTAFSMIGISLIILSSYRLYINYQQTRSILILPIITLVVGFILLFDLHKLMFILIALYLLFEPIVNIIKSVDKKQQMIFELPEIIFALIILLLGTSTIFYIILFRLLGVVFIIVGIYLTFCIYKGVQIGVKKDRDIIDG